MKILTWSHTALNLKTKSRKTNYGTRNTEEVPAESEAHPTTSLSKLESLHKSVHNAAHSFITHTLTSTPCKSATCATLERTVTLTAQRISLVHCTAFTVTRHLSRTTRQHNPLHPFISHMFSIPNQPAEYKGLSMIPHNPLYSTG